MSQDTYQALVIGVPAVGDASEKGGSAVLDAPLYHPVPYPEETS